MFSGSRLPALLVVLMVAAAAAEGAPVVAARVPDAWLTPAERSGYAATPDLAATVAFLRKVETAAPFIRVTSFGTSPAGRDMPLVIVSKERAFTPASAGALGKPVVLIQSGIHAGEIDGKDACLALLRDLALGRDAALLDAATVLIVPIYNVDGHERVSPFNRPNQDGPRDGMGFRTTADGLDLNRDYLKLSSPESRALVALFNRWRPHLHVDVHVTDGVDHDWVLTYAWAEAPQAPASVDGWLRSHLPGPLAATERAGFRCGPYVDLLDRNDPAKGFSSLVGGARYSTGYFPLRNRPSLLIEMHSYKPYRQRVEAVHVFLAALLAEIGRDPRALRAAVAEAESREVGIGGADAPPSETVLRWADGPADTIEFPVYAYRSEISLVTGAPLLRYQRGDVHALRVPWIHRVTPALTTARPRGYLVLPGWPQISSRLAGHGLVVRRLAAPADLEVDSLWANDAKFAARPYQGLTPVEASIAHRPLRRHFPAGTLWVPADQPDFEVAVQLLEPESPESLFAWGMLTTVLEGKEYMDGRVLEGRVTEMLADPAVRDAWEKALADPAFAADAGARSRWWYRRTPSYRVQEVGLLPIFRMMTTPALTTGSWPAAPEAGAPPR
ncbi:MAG: M14 family zinc carboxypeptidase [Acidobacteriota bacterium]